MLDGYVSEKEQIESIRKFWNEHGKFIVIAIVVGLAIGFGWRYFHTFEKRRAENAAIVYQSIMSADAKGDVTTVQGGATVLMTQFSSSPYASLAALLSAKEAISKNDLSGALTSLQWVIKNSDQKRLQQVARIYAARILLSQNNPAAATNEIKIVDDKSFEPLIDWVKGDIDTQEKNAVKERAHYEDAKREFAEFPPAVDFLDKQIAQPI
jgi:predicted negative regulator of RcsB-dependent stress response